MYGRRSNWKNSYITALNLSLLIVYSINVIEFSPTSSHQYIPSPLPGTPLAISISPTVLIASDNYTLTCDIIYNFPTATVTWRRADSAPLSTGRFTTTPSGGLNISPVAPNDGGVYECVASNEYGTSVVSAAVTVHGELLSISVSTSTCSVEPL